MPGEENGEVDGSGETDELDDAAAPGVTADVTGEESDEADAFDDELDADGEVALAHVEEVPEEETAFARGRVGVGVELEEESAAEANSDEGIDDVVDEEIGGHDVEEFYGVVKRWGASDSVKRLVEITKNAPFVSDFNVSACCGNCVIG